MDEYKYKRPKRKRSFMQLAKKHAKRGYYGHGTHIEEDVFQYLCRAVELLNRGFDSEEEQRMFANNVLEQAANNEIELSCNQVASRALESVVPFADTDHVHSFEKAFQQNLRLAFVDTFCSYVTQKLIQTSTNRVINGDETLEDSFAFRCYKFAVNNIEEFAVDSFACHVVRTCVDCLAQLGEKAPKDVVKLYYTTVIESSILSDLAQQELGSGLLQRILYCLKTVLVKTCQKAITKMLNSIFIPEELKSIEEGKEKTLESNEIPKAFTSMPIIRLLEAAIECSMGKRFTQIYAKLFINRLGALVKDRMGNMAVQKLIKNCNDDSEFESIFDEIVPHLRDILSCGYTGVIESLAAKCQSTGSKQGEFLNALMTALDILTPENKQITLCQKCITIGGRSYSENPIGLHGSLIIQSMLHFKKPIKVINSLVSMDPGELVQLLSDTKGCHISDAFFTGQFIGEKSKDKLVNKLKNHFAQLASDKYGSRSFEQIWEGVGLKQKCAIIEELNKRETDVRGTEFGRIVASKIGLSSYRRNKESWEKVIRDRGRNREMFKGILEKPRAQKKEESDNF